MDSTASVIVLFLLFGLGILVLRFVGAWMLRIDEVIMLLREIRDLLKGGKE